MGKAVDQSFSQMAPSDIRALVSYVRSVPPAASPDLPAMLAQPAPVSPKDGGATPDALGKKIFEESCVSCHNWTGVSAITPTRLWPARGRSTIAPPPMSPRS
jgi:cytochrome c